MFETKDKIQANHAVGNGEGRKAHCGAIVHGEEVGKRTR